MKIYFLGTNGWYDSETGYTLSILIETKNEFIILDAGSGIYKADRFIKKAKPVYLFLSHFHLDHIIGLHVLEKFRFPKGIDIIGPLGLTSAINTIVNRPYSVPLKELGIDVRMHELNRKPRLSLNFEYRKLLHSSLCYGYRFNIENKTIVFCTDTGLCRNLLLLAKNADLLILECSFKSRQKNDDWPHLNPEEAATMAKEAGVRKLALVHFDASLYKSKNDRNNSEKLAQRIFPETFAASDDLKIKV